MAKGAKGTRAVQRQRMLEMKQRIMVLKRQGLTHNQVAAEIGVSKQRVSQLWLEELRDIQEETAYQARLARTAELDRIDALMRRAWPLAVGENPSRQWFDRVLRCLEMRAKLLGLHDRDIVGNASDDNVSSNEYVIKIRAPTAAAANDNAE